MNIMKTLLIAISKEMVELLENTAQETGLEEMDVVRQALQYYTEELAVQKVLRCSAEPNLSGDLENLRKQV